MHEHGGVFLQNCYLWIISKFAGLRKKPKQAETEPHGPAREPIVRRGRRIACGCSPKRPWARSGVGLDLEASAQSLERSTRAGCSFVSYKGKTEESSRAPALDLEAEAGEAPMARRRT